VEKNAESGDVYMKTMDDKEIEESETIASDKENQSGNDDETVQIDVKGKRPADPSSTISALLANKEVSN
jgi:hypothetical protein